ncbi:MAG TPA: peptide ABC transporter ATP-binding protein, partial [Clostridiaceae bacterium]|nr:peptide ABC transporter ATP-binding protein [Clostridiaceae bacterium]
VNLLRPTSGQIIFEGHDITKLNKKEQRRFHKNIQIIFQDPYASLDPRMTIGDIIAEPIKINNIAKGAEVEKRVQKLLDYVGLASYHRNRYPHEFSG